MDKLIIISGLESVRQNFEKSSLGYEWLTDAIKYIDEISNQLKGE